MRKYSPTIRLSIQTSPITAGIRATINISTRDENHNEASGWLDWGDQSPRATWTKPSPTVLTHTYAAAGLYTITAAEHDTTRLEGIASAAIEVVPGPSVPVIVPGGPTALTITAANRLKTVGDLVTFAGTEFTTSGLLGGDTVSSVTLTSAGTPTSATVGAYTIAPSVAVGTGLTNYTITYVSGALTVAAAPDTTAPVVAFTAPPVGNVPLSGAVTLAVTATDAVGVVGVRFKVDGVNIGAEDLVAPFTLVWDSSSVADGSHTLSAVARDAAGNTATATRNITVLQVVSDITAPVVTWVIPSANATVSGTVTLTVTATDDTAVTGVLFKVDGVAINSEVMVAPFTTAWVTAPIVDGLHQLTATARDAAGNTTTTALFVTTLQPVAPPIDNSPPVVSFTSPASVPLGGTVNITVTATDNVGVVGVQLYVDGVVYGAELLTGPFTRPWDTTLVSEGMHTLTARARDAAGNLTTEAHIAFVANTAGSSSIIQASDITYVGAIRMPNTIDTSAAYGGMAGRQVAGVTHLFIYGNFTSDPATAFPIYELSEPGSGYSTDYRTAPRATLVTNWEVPYGTKRHTWDADGVAIAPAGNVFFPTGLYWNASTALLYWGYCNTYPSNLPPEWGFGATALTNPVGPVTTAYGPWRTQSTDGDGSLWYGPQNAASFMAHPVTGKMLCGGTSRSINTQVPWGPQVWGSIDWPTAATPGGFGAANLVLADRYLCYYFMGGPNSGANHTTHYFLSDGTPNDGVIRSFRLIPTSLTNIFESDFEGPPILSADPTKTGVATWTDEQDAMGGMLWLELTHKRGVLFVGTLVGGYSLDSTDAVNTAHNWYRNSGVGHEFCRHGHTAPVTVTGPVSTKKVPVLVIYNPDKLTNVKDGIAVDYEQNADSIIDLELTYGIKTATMNQLTAKGVAGFYWDPARNYLFIIASHADDSRAGDAYLESLIHVFHIADTP